MKPAACVWVPNTRESIGFNRRRVVPNKMARAMTQWLPTLTVDPPIERRGVQRPYLFQSYLQGIPSYGSASPNVWCSPWGELIQQFLNWCGDKSTVTDLTCWGPGVVHLPLPVCGAEPLRSTVFGRRKCMTLIKDFMEMVWEGGKMPYPVKKVCVRSVMWHEMQQSMNWFGGRSTVT